MIYRIGLQIRHGARCGAPWLGHPSFSKNQARLRRWCWRYHKIWVGLGDLYHISGRCSLAITAHPVTFHWLWMSAPSTMRLSLSPAAISVLLEQGHPLRSPPVMPPTAWHYASAPTPAPLWGSPNGDTYITSPRPQVLQRDVLWWHRTPSSSQGPFLCRLGGPVLPASLTDRWPLPGDSFTCSLEESQQQRIPKCLLNWYKGLTVVRGELLHKCPLLLEWKVQCKMSMVACYQPWIVSALTLPIPPPFLIAKFLLRPGQPWSRQCRGFWWPTSVPSLWRRLPFWQRSAGLKPIWYWSAL